MLNNLGFMQKASNKRVPASMAMRHKDQLSSNLDPESRFQQTLAYFFRMRLYPAYIRITTGVDHPYISSASTIILEARQLLRLFLYPKTSISQQEKQ